MESILTRGIHCEESDLGATAEGMCHERPEGGTCDASTPLQAHTTDTLLQSPSLQVFQTLTLVSFGGGTMVQV